MVAKKRNHLFVYGNIMLITSTQNSKVKRVRALLKDKKARDESNAFVVEGVTMVKDIPDFCKPETILVKQSKLDKYENLLCKVSEYDVVKDEVFDSMCDTVTPNGIIVVLKKFETKPISGDMVLLLDGVSDAGNVGTILRSAACRGVETIVLCDCADIYSPKVVRASMGGIFFVNCIQTDRKTALNLLKEYDVVCLDMDGESIYEYKRNGKIALAVGNEAHGVSEEIRANSAYTLAIPIKNVESLNAGVSASISMFIIQ